MTRKSIVATALAGLLTVTAATGTTAAAAPPAQTWIPIFYFGTQTYCVQAGVAGQQFGVLTAGRWKCDSGWLMTLPPEFG